MKPNWVLFITRVLRGRPYRLALLLAVGFAVLSIGRLHAQAITIVNLCSSDNQAGAGTNLDAAMAVGGWIRFNCPPGSEISVTTTKPIQNDTIIDGLNGNNPVTLINAIPAGGGALFPIFDVRRGVNLELSDIHLVHRDPSTLGMAVQSIGSVRAVNVQVDGFYVGLDATLGDLRILNSRFMGNNLSVTFTHNIHQVVILNARFIGNSRGISGADGIFPDAVPPDQQISIAHSLFVDNATAVQNCADDDCQAPFLVTVANSILAQRPESTDDNAMAVRGRGVRLVNSTILGFRAIAISSESGGEIILANTLVVNNGVNCQGTIVADGANLQFPGLSCGPGIRSANPMLGQFLEPLLTSPAYNAGDNAVCAAAPVGNRDYYYQSRPRATRCSIGAVEGELLKPPALPPLNVEREHD